MLFVRIITCSLRIVLCYKDANTACVRLLVVKCKKKAPCKTFRSAFLLSATYKLINFQCSRSRQESGNFFPFGIMADIFTLHSMSVFHFVRDAVRAALSSMWLDVSCCHHCVSPHSTVSPRVHVLPHNGLRSAVLSQSLAGIKEPEPVKRKTELVVWPPFVSFLPNLFFRGQEAICLQTKELMQASPSLPTSQPPNVGRLKYLHGGYSSSGPSDLAVELRCMVWYV